MHTLISLCFVLFSTVGLAKKQTEKASAESSYERGLRLLKNGYTERALEEFNRVRNYYRDDPISLKAQLAIADTYFRKGDFEQGRQEYEEFASYHPRHPDMDFVTWRIGQCIWKDAPHFAGRDQTKTRSAVNAWTGFSTRYPDSEYRADVEELLQRGRDRLAVKEVYIAEFYARRGAWGAVRGRAEGVLDRYSDTEIAPVASVLLGKALHKWGESAAAVSVLEHLTTKWPDDAATRKLGRLLARPAGTQPEEPVFIRPYRVRLPVIPGA